MPDFVKVIGIKLSNITVFSPRVSRAARHAEMLCRLNRMVGVSTGIACHFTENPSRETGVMRACVIRKSRYSSKKRRSVACKKKRVMLHCQQLTGLAYLHRGENTMPAIDDMTLEEVEAAMSRLRERRRTLKKTGKAAERKIGTLARRRERLMDRVREIDDQIEALRNEAAMEVPPAPRRRGRRPKSAQITTE